ncbi:MAG: glycosyltransferase [Nitrospiria bacterium]
MKRPTNTVLQGVKTVKERNRPNKQMKDGSKQPRPDLFLFVFSSWLIALAWFHPRLYQLFDMAQDAFQTVSLGFFMIFVELAWLYGFYNIGVILFALFYRWSHHMHKQNKEVRFSPNPRPPAVALLYTTCNDFVEESARSCVRQDYPEFTVYILDDSADPNYRSRVDRFAALYPEQVRVVRRTNRKGFKAGNLNHALGGAAAGEPVFALADADEILPTDFLSRLVPRLLNDPTCGFVQANHRFNQRDATLLPKAMGDGVDIHWRWYQPLRNKYGFVMLLGHGAVLRREAWEAVGGFPELVSEDLAYALRLREIGWKGHFAEDVICYEDFPDTMKAFRIRYMKWTRGTCELLSRELGRILRAKKISLAEKCDILLPTLNLPLSMCYFLFIINANLVIPMLFGSPRPLTLSVGGSEYILPLRGLDPGFEGVYSLDFFMITLLTLISPILCFIIELGASPLRLFRFLCRSTTIYAALGPLASLGVFSYFVTGKATFLVTGDQSNDCGSTTKTQPVSLYRNLRDNLKKMFLESHPGHTAVQVFEGLCGLSFAFTAIFLANLSFLGLAIAFLLQPMMHRVSWENPVVQHLVYLPFLLIVGGIGVSLLGLLGVQPVFFGYGFHF